MLFPKLVVAAFVLRDLLKNFPIPGIARPRGEFPVNEILGDFMSLAREALDQRSQDADRVGAVLVAAALEETLKHLGAMHNLDVYNRDFRGVIQKLKDADILGGADAAYDTLVEIQQALQSGTSGLDAILAAVNLRVRFDAAQTLTVAEQLQARTNIGAVAVSEVGNTDTDFVAIFDGALA